MNTWHEWREIARAVSALCFGLAVVLAILHFSRSKKEKAMNALVVNPETLRKLREVHEIQGRDANWQANPYMRGLYNGLELAMAILEERDPKYKEGFDVPPASLL